MDFVEKFIVKHTAVFQKVVAFLCAVGILALCVLGSFAVPSLFASAEDSDSYGEYVDDLAGVVVELVESGTVSKGSAALLGVQLALNEAHRTAIQVGHNFNLRNFSGLSGLYKHNDELHFAWCALDGGSYINTADGGSTLMQSDELDVRCIITTDGYNRTYTAGIQSYVNNNCRAVLTCNGGKYVTYSVSVADSGGSDIFTAPASWDRFEDYSSSYTVGCYYASNGVIPELEDDSSLSTYFNTNEYLSSASPVASWADVNVSPRIDGVDLPEPDFDFENNSIQDYILEYFNPWIEVEYPDLTVYLWDPSEDPTEGTTECTECGGCNCIHNITVNVEPTVNVNVEPTVNVYVENQLPSEWLEDYTLPSGGVVETLPEPTMPTVQETQDMTLPTMEIDFPLSDGMHFWAELWTSLVFATDILPVVIIVLLLTIAEWVLWHVGR